MTHTPNYMRYMRVDTILRSDKALRLKLSEPSYPVERTDGSGTDLFSKEVVAMTRLVHDEGHDVATMPKPALIKVAVDLLVTHVRKMPELPMPASKQPEKPKAPKAEPKKVAKKKAAAAPASAKKSDRKGAAANGAPAADADPLPTTPPAALPSSRNGNHDDPESFDEGDLSSTDRFRPVSSKGPFPFVVGCAAVSNIMAGCQLLTAYGGDDYVEIVSRLNQLIEEIQAKAKIPTSVKAA